MDNYASLYQKYLDTFNDYLHGKIDISNYEGRDSEGFYSVMEAITYSLTNGGKRIRPVLTLEFCRLCSGDYTAALDLALAIEMIHTYSLIHDDLPCMDNDDMRRGKPSNHIVYGYANSLLAGDGLQALAFETVARSALTDDRKTAAVTLLADAAGPCGMVAGQMMDLNNENRYIGIEDIQATDILKTGKLITAAALMGCIAAGADREKFLAAETYSKNIGLAFQIVDDILDVTGDENKLGKPVGSDEESGKSTYVTTLGIDEAKSLAKELTFKAVNALTVFGDEAWFLEELASKLLYRES